MNKSGEEFAESEETAAEEVVATDEVSAADDSSEMAEEEIVEIDPFTAMANERDEFQQKWLRVVAELDNVRKRGARELVQTRKFAQADVLRSVLEIQDNLERALSAVADTAEGEEPENFRQGVELIQQKTSSLLKDKNVVLMEALNKPFDPNFHEAVGQLPREGVEADIVIEVVQQGYQFGDMVLRAARVIVST
ncbi:MAG: molecular chaperone GrpE [Candidatus Krumholzibacteriia bacterium]|jgi:molecular chaperone GrpE